MILASAAAFSLLHVIYGNAPAVIFSFIGGYLFSRTYADTQSLFVTSLEHAIYGNMVFTVGLGHYFYEGFQQEGTGLHSRVILSRYRTLS